MEDRWTLLKSHPNMEPQAWSAWTSALLLPESFAHGSIGSKGADSYLEKEEVYCIVSNRRIK